MKERVVSLSDRGRALEWLSLGFGLWLIAGLVFALNALDVRSRIDADGVVTVSGVLAMASSIAHLFAGAAIGFGAYIMLHAGSPLWSGCTLAALVVAVVERSILVWLPLLDLQSVWSIGAIAQLMLVGSAFLGIRQLASGEGRPVPLTLLGVLVGAEIARLLLLATYWLEGARMRHDAMLPSVRVALVGVASVVSMGIVLLSIREASVAVRAQIWAGQPGASAPARAADWQRTAAGLDRAGAFLIGKLAIAAAAMPLLLIGLLTGTEELLARFLVPFASAVFSAGMVTGLLACRRVPDPPDARAGFTGAALLVAACLAGELYALSAHAGEPLAEAVSALGHLVAYLALLRSIGRIGERLGADDVTRRARILALIAVPAVGGGTVAGYLLVQHADDLGLAVGTPVVVAGLAFAALLPAALLARQLAAGLRQRFAEPPRARVLSG